MDSYYSFRFKRWRRRTQKKLAATWDFIKKVVQVFFIARTNHLKRVRRFIIGSLLVLVLAVIVLSNQFSDLHQYYQGDGPRAGGTFISGTVGEITNLNPLFPEGQVSEATNRLIFNGLLRYNAKGELEGDLASNWQVNPEANEYTVTLRDGIFWHDGQPLTANDVVFTVKTIQQPDTRTPLSASWEGVSARAVDSKTVAFRLPHSYSPFLNTMTTSILPEHILGSVTPAQLRKAEFNQHPIGSGPFIFEEILATQKAVRLRANGEYIHGEPLLKHFIVRAYANEDELVNAFNHRQVSAAAGFGTTAANVIAKEASSKLYRLATTNQAFVFINNEHPILSDVKVRQGLTQATNFRQLASQFDYQLTPADAPLLPWHLGYNKASVQLPFDATQATANLEAAGWKAGTDGIRAKNDQLLKLQLLAPNTDIYPQLARSLQEQWRKVGVKVETRLVSTEQLQQEFLQPRKYDLMLFGVALGADPDVYSYWHSSQIKFPGLNIARYKSQSADFSLESARTRSDPNLRAAKYEAFLKTWAADAPSIAIYRPAFLYAVQNYVQGIDVINLISPGDRFYNVEKWSVNTKPVLQRLAQ